MTDADLNRGALEPTPSWLKPAPAPAPVTPPAPAPAPITYSAPAPTPAPATYSSPTTYSAPTTQVWSGFLGGAAPTDTQKAYAQSKGISFDQAAYELGKSQTNNTTTASTPAPTTSTTPTTTGTGLQGQAPSEQVKEYAVQKGISFDQAYNELSSSGQIKEAPKVTDPLSQNKVSGTDIRIPNVLNDVNFNTGKTGNLTDKQKSELQIAWDRASSGNANQEDYNNLKNAIENLGWKPTVTTDAARIASEKADADAAAAAAAATTKSFQDKIDATNKALDENYTKITNLIDSLTKGTIALTANQQTLIDSIQTNLVKATAAQKTANANYEAGLTQAGIAAGRNRYAPEIEMGNIYNAINLGASKINDLDAAAVAKKAELMEQFQTNNYQNAIASYKELQSILKDKEDTIIKMEIMARDYAKEARDEEYRATQDILSRQVSMLNAGYEKISSPDQLAGLTEDQIVRIGREIYKKPDLSTTVDLQTVKGDDGSIYSFNKINGDMELLLPGSGVDPADISTFGNSESGYYTINKRTGEINQITQPTTSKKFTESQTKDAIFASKLERGVNNLEELNKDGKIYTPTKKEQKAVDQLLTQSWADNVPFVKAFNNIIKDKAYQSLSSETKRWLQSSLEIAQAILRKESGAAISAQEIFTYGMAYVPRFGDDTSSLIQKQEAVNGYLQGFKFGSGGAYEEMMGYGDNTKTTQDSDEWIF